MLVNGKIKLSKKSIADFKAAKQTNDVSETEIQKVIAQVFAENPTEAARLKNGEDKLINFFFGAVMKKLGKTANPRQIRQALLTSLSS